ncbi:MAG: PCRF domain-containing protein, partial [Bacteroidia bacterium]|nr:PCRF domain-containing protein [Bacteroidia bacterium]
MKSLVLQPMLEKLEGIERKFREIEEKLSDPAVVSDMGLFKKLNLEYKELKPVVEASAEYRKTLKGIEEAKTILQQASDKEMMELAEADLPALEEKKAQLEEEIRKLLIPKDPEDFRNAIMEIRAGTGGDEAAIFAGDLFEMYKRYCDKKGFRTEIQDYNPGTMGGYKEIIFKVVGEGAYGLLKYESGVHRVQRVPATETQGRVHTSAATVAVFPEAEDV